MTPAAPAGLTATARLARVELDWNDVADPDVDGYDVFRATSATGPFTRVNPSRLSGSAYTDASVNGGTAYFYAVAASDEANNRSPLSATASATPPSTHALLRAYSPRRATSAETYFADSAAELTDNYVAGSRQNYLFNGNGTRLAAANPADALPTSRSPSSAIPRTPTAARPRPPTTSTPRTPSTSRTSADARRRLRRPRLRARAHVGRQDMAAVLAVLLLQPAERARVRRARGRLGVRAGRPRRDGLPDVATYAQHGGGERCAWSQVQKSGGVPVVFVALASHASYFSSGVNPRGLYPDDYHRGTGYQVRPALEIVSQATPFMAWQGKWGASSSSRSRRGARASGARPTLQLRASSCTVGAAQATATASALRAGAAVDEPQIDVTREGGLASVRYRFDARPSSLVVSVALAGVPDVATARVRASREGVVSSACRRALPGRTR